jgi:hypothetical protein
LGLKRNYLRRQVLETSTTKVGYWSGLRRKRVKGKLGWRRRIGEEEFRVFKIFFVFPRLSQILSRFKIE